jgi:hypothetical protein
MGARHVEDLFSAAYDDALDAADRQRYEAHLAACPECAAAERDFRRSIDAVRELPPARMPVRVVLPSTPPVAERARRLLPGWGPLRVPQLGPAWGAGALALVGIVAVVVAARGHVVGGPSGASNQSRFGSIPNVGTSLASSGCPLPLQVTAATPGVTAGGGPAGFTYRVSVRDPQRPGEELVLATTAKRFAAGSQVLVFAALTSSAADHRAAVPCVALEPQEAVALNAPGLSDKSVTGAGGPANVGGSGAAGAARVPPTAAPGMTPPAASATGTPAAAQAPHPATSPQPDLSMVNGSAPAAGDLAQRGTLAAPPGYAALSPEQVLSFSPYLLERPLALGAPSGQTVGETLPVQVLTIPVSIPRGTVLRIVALVPSGVPDAGDHPAVEAVLVIEVG